MSDARLLGLILAVAAASYALRVIPLALLRRPLRNPRLVAFIERLPYAILAAMVVPDVFSSTGEPASAAVGFAVALVLALLGRSLPVVAAAATAAAVAVVLALPSAPRAEEPAPPEPPAAPAPEPAEPPAEQLRVFSVDDSFDLAFPSELRILLVGGGGGGGAECGGGGGGGAVVEIASTNFPAGSYRVAVGAGGAGGYGNSSPGEQGRDGGDTTFARVLPNGVADVLFQAPGGGGGGGWGGGDFFSRGRTGGSGGGGANSRPGGAGTHGGKGGDSLPPDGGSRRPAGGGGAGGPAPDVNLAKDQGTSGAGGPGVASDITGTNLVYGAGGGGGAYNNAAGSGGSGLGGHGCRECHPPEGDEHGRDGFGEGGGGGNNNATSAGEYRGANGGSGVAIVRIRPLPADEAAALIASLPEDESPSSEKTRESPLRAESVPILAPVPDRRPSAPNRRTRLALRILAGIRDAARTSRPGRPSF